jgi:hypothetical protein
VIGALIFVVILHTFNSLAAPISNLVGWGLPAYLSFKAIESPSPHDDVQWLTYWVVFGFFNFLESFALRVVLYYVPWYFAFKSLFIVWLQLPAFRVSPLLFSFCFLAPLHLFHCLHLFASLGCSNRLLQCHQAHPCQRKLSKSRCCTSDHQPRVDCSH